MGRDHGCSRSMRAISSFQSTLPAWGETGGRRDPRGPQDISIHSPRMGRDKHYQQEVIAHTYFNPLSPHGERPNDEERLALLFAFQSTLPAWGETAKQINKMFPELFQSTLPAWGETKHQLSEFVTPQHFNPLSPHGERHIIRFADFIVIDYFNPLSPHGERLTSGDLIFTDLDFNPLSPHGERRQQEVDYYDCR